jgi:hypothetical protein
MLFKSIFSIKTILFLLLLFNNFDVLMLKINKKSKKIILKITHSYNSPNAYSKITLSAHGKL